MRTKVCRGLQNWSADCELSSGDAPVATHFGGASGIAAAIPSTIRYLEFAISFFVYTSRIGG